MSAINAKIKNVLALIIISCVAFFFYRAFRSNWSSIQQSRLDLDYFFILLSSCMILCTYLISTYSWSLAVNHLSSGVKLHYLESVAVVNTSNLTKYLPGKVWSYALQMYWLGEIGFKKTLILYVNLINLFISIITSLLLGLSFLIVFSDVSAVPVVYLSLGIVIVIDIIFILFNPYFSKMLILGANKALKQTMEYYHIPISLSLYLHLLNLVAAFSFGIGAYFLSKGLGFDIAPGKMFLIMSSMIISDVIGFLAIIVPGGLGVRESIMYLFLSGSSTQSLALILPVASRVVNMLVDLSLGLFSYLLLKNRLRGSDNCD